MNSFAKLNKHRCIEHKLKVSDVTFSITLLPCGHGSPHEVNLVTSADCVAKLAEVALHHHSSFTQQLLEFFLANLSLASCRGRSPRAAASRRGQLRGAAGQTSFFAKETGCSNGIASKPGQRGSLRETLSAVKAFISRQIFGE